MNILGEENIDKSLSVHYLIYRIENTVNQKHYIGQHVTDNPHDKYMGSGFLLKRAEYKYGLSAFTKEILFDFDNFEDMNAKEIELVPLSACYPLDPMSYNLREGGHNGIHNEESIKKLSESQKRRFANMSEEENQQRRERIKQYWKNRTDEEKAEHGKRIKLSWSKRTPEWKQKYSALKSEQTKGKNNPMYGKSIMDIMSDDQIIEWKRKLGERAHALWQDEEYRKKVLSQTLQKPGLNHDCRQYMTDEQITKWKENLSKAGSGKNNPMYGKSSWEKCTEEQRAKRIEKFKKSMAGKNAGKRCMKLPGETHYKYVKPDEVQIYLGMGYEFYSRNKGKKFRK